MKFHRVISYISLTSSLGFLLVCRRNILCLIVMDCFFGLAWFSSFFCWRFSCWLNILSIVGFSLAGLKRTYLNQILAFCDDFRSFYRFWRSLACSCRSHDNNSLMFVRSLVRRSSIDSEQAQRGIEGFCRSSANLLDPGFECVVVAANTKTVSSTLTASLLRVPTAEGEVGSQRTHL